MDTRLNKRWATACALAGLLALGACGNSGDPGTETAAERQTRQEMGAGASAPPPSEEAAARSAAQRSGAVELSRGEGT